jgi:hypothetical protein
LKKYNYAIDTSIIDSLFQYEKGDDTNSQMSSGQLKKSVEKRLKIPDGSLSPDTFSFRIRQMTENKTVGDASRYAASPILDREFQGKGKKVFYSLTNHARIRLRLGLSIFKIDTLREIAALLLFFYLQHSDISRSQIEHTPKYKFTTEKQFNDFLSRSYLHRENFEIFYTHEDEETGYHFTKMVSTQMDGTVTKVEYDKNNINPKYSNSRQSQNYSYVYSLPGISPRDFLGGKKTGMVFEHILSQNKLTLNDIEEIFSLLKGEKIIYEIKSWAATSLDEIRYDVNKDLKELIFDCWSGLFGAVVIRMGFTWKNFRRPTKEEKIWYEIIWGHTRSNIFFNQYKQTRSTRIIKKYLSKEKKESRQKSKDAVLSDIHTLDGAIKKGFEDIHRRYKDVINEYNYPSDMMLKLVYPKFLRDLHKQGKI